MEGKGEFHLPLNNFSDAQRLEYILKATGTGFDIIDRDFNLRFVDRPWREYYGPPEGYKCYEYFKDRKRPCEDCAIPRALKTGQIAHSEQVLPKEGHRLVACHTIPFKNRQGEYLVAEFKVDITVRKQLENKLRYLLQFEKMVSTISHRFVSIDADKISEMIDHSLEQVGKFFDVDRGVIFQFSPTEETMHTTHEWRAEGVAPLTGIVKRFSVKEMPWLFAQIQTLAHIYTFDVDSLPPEAAIEKEEFMRQDFKSFLILPFSVGADGYKNGFLGFDTVRKKKTWTEEQIDLLGIVAEIFDSAFTRRELEEERNKALNMLKKSESRYRAIVENINDALLIFDFKMKILELNEVAYRMLGFKRTDLLGANLTAIISLEDQPRVPERIKELSKYERLLFEGNLIHRNSTSIPVEISLKLVSREGDGLIQAFIRNITKRKQAEQQVVDYTLQLENLYLTLNEEINKARQVHQRTLPKSLPMPKGISLAAHYQPAEKLGGDFYDVVQLGKKLIIYLSDVTGHGVDGAMLSMFVKHTIRGFLFFAPEENICPEKILSYLSAQFHQKELSDEYFICIFLAVLNLETMELTYSAAGFQDTPLVRLGNGEHLKLISKGLFLSSAFSDELLNLQEKSIFLTPGTTVFFNTDGLTEQSSQGTYYGTRLPSVFYESSHLSPELIARIVIEDFRNFNGGSLQGSDDITFLVLQVDPQLRVSEHLELINDFRELNNMHEKASAILGDCKGADLFLVCLHELAANAIEHGNRLDREKNISVEVIITDRFIQGNVQDQGGGFNWREQIIKPFDLAGTSERGRGLAMVRICSEKLFYNDKGNRAMFVIEACQEENNHVD